MLSLTTKKIYENILKNSVRIIIKVNASLILKIQGAVIHKIYRDKKFKKMK